MCEICSWEYIREHSVLALKPGVTSPLFFSADPTSANSLSHLGARCASDGLEAEVSQGGIKRGTRARASSWRDPESKGRHWLGGMIGGVQLSVAEREEERAADGWASARKGKLQKRKGRKGKPSGSGKFLFCFSNFMFS